MCSYVVSFVFISSSSLPFEGGEGLAPFLRSRTRGRRCPTCRPRSLMSAKREPDVHRSRDMRPGDRGPRGKRQADRFDVRQEFVRKKPEPVSSLGKRTGASPSCRECLLNPCLLMLPFRFAHAMRMRPLFVGRVHERLSSSGTKSKFKIVPFPSPNPAFSIAYADPTAFGFCGAPDAPLDRRVGLRPPRDDSLLGLAAFILS